MFILSYGCTPVAGSDVEFDEVVVNFFGQVVESQVALGIGNGVAVCALNRSFLDQASQRFRYRRSKIRVTVKFFASYREVIDEDEEVYEVPSGGSLNSLRVLITATHPVLKDVEDTMLASVNESFVDDEEVELEEGDVVAFFPPLSGG